MSQIFTNLLKIGCKWKFELIFFSGTCLWVTVYFKNVDVLDQAQL